MPYFPVFMNIENKRVVVIGGGGVALRKVEKLLPFKPTITVIAPKVVKELVSMEREGRIKIVRRRFNSKDIEDSFLVIGATNNRKVNRRIYKIASRKGILCNIVDDPELCSFIFPALITKRDLCIGITTSGKAPSVSKLLKEWISEFLPENIDKVIEKHYVKRKIKR